MHPVKQDSSDTRDLLWTSGWDSTFRLLSALLLEGATVRPHYVVDPTRPSTEAEMKAMANIRSGLEARYPEAALRLLPTEYGHRDDVPAIPATERRFASLTARGQLGSQYEWLARYAASKGMVDLELSIHRDDKAHHYLDGNVQPIRYRSTTVYRLTDAAAKTDLALFERFTFPLFDVSKRDMRSLAIHNGFIDILELSWFCHTPLAGQPCGTCVPCNDAIKEGLGYRIPPVSRLRHRLSAAVPLRRLARYALHVLRPAARAGKPRAAGTAVSGPSVRATSERPITPASLRSTAERLAPRTDGGIG